jgi:hypothetical protein
MPKYAAECTRGRILIFQNTSPDSACDKIRLESEWLLCHANSLMLHA